MSIKTRLERLEKGDSANTMASCLAWVDQLGRDIPDLAPKSEEARQEFARFIHGIGGPENCPDAIWGHLDMPGL